MERKTETTKQRSHLEPFLFLLGMFCFVFYAVTKVELAATFFGLIGFYFLASSVFRIVKSRFGGDKLVKD